MIEKLFGNTGQQVTIVGLGGEGILRTSARNDQARQVIQTAISEGISYFDSAHVYSDSELYYGSVWKDQPKDRSRIFQASKSASRDKKGAAADLEKTLIRMQCDYLDLWQIHDVRTEEDLYKISDPGGALEAFTEAKASGKVRFIGVTGHHDPHILTRAVRELPIDAVMMPVNPVEGLTGGFLTSTLPEAKKKGIAVIGMKILGASHYIFPQWNISPELLVRYALSQEITVGIVGCSSPDEVRTLATVGRNFKPLSQEEELNLLSLFRPYTNRLLFYRKLS